MTRKSIGKHRKTRLKSSHVLSYDAPRREEQATGPDDLPAGAPEHDESGRFASHVPIMVAQVLEALQVRPGGAYVDGTLGEGGHTLAIWQRSQPGGRLLALDADEDVVARAGQRFALYQGITIAHGNFRSLAETAERHGFTAVNGIVLDLGLNTLQLAAGRGFSFSEDAPLDMRFDRRQPLTADEVVNRYSESDLARVIRDYGQEPDARRIARAIVRNRPIAAARDLAVVVAQALPYRHSRLHPATRVFQAVRMEVNQELGSLQEGLTQALALLATGGRLAVISYHSLEDGAVKRALRQAASDCICPPRTPACICGHRRLVRLVQPALWRPDPAEVQSNPRCRSARMRVAERIAGR